MAFSRRAWLAAGLAFTLATGLAQPAL
ncbi:MAG: hypothetical protein JWQ88_302, partial [Rhodoferax sp.]|nr:hypothetical protein [Rhodoferax sp.]